MHRFNGASSLRRVIFAAVALALAISLTACGGGSTQSSGETTTTPTQSSEVILSSTTSTQDSGLFDVLTPAFEKANPQYTVKIIAVGTGEALKLARTGDADVVLAHAKADEEKLVADGIAIDRKDVMYNDFVIVGPANDPASVTAAADITAAVKAIETAGEAGKAVFYSRGDDSGTNKKELKLWAASGVTTPTPETDKWYKSTGSGMGDTLQVTSDDPKGYTLTDRATYLSMKDALDLVILREGDKDLLNQYGVLVVKGAKNQTGGQAFYGWILSPQGQEVIKNYGVQKYGQALFVPNAH